MVHFHGIKRVFEVSTTLGCQRTHLNWPSTCRRFTSGKISTGPPTTTPSLWRSPRGAAPASGMWRAKSKTTDALLVSFSAFPFPFWIMARVFSLFSGKTISWHFFVWVLLAFGTFLFPIRTYYKGGGGNCISDRGTSLLVSFSSFSWACVNR